MYSMSELEEWDVDDWSNLSEDLDEEHISEDEAMEEVGLDKEGDLVLKMRKFDLQKKLAAQQLEFIRNSDRAQILFDGNKFAVLYQQNTDPTKCLTFEFAFEAPQDVSCRMIQASFPFNVLKVEKGLFHVFYGRFFVLREENQWYVIEGGSCKKVRIIQKIGFKNTVSITSINICRDDSKGFDTVEFVSVSPI